MGLGQSERTDRHQLRLVAARNNHVMMADVSEAWLKEDESSVA